jgi:hypothetical protein
LNPFDEAPATTAASGLLWCEQPAARSDAAAVVCSTCPYGWGSSADGKRLACKPGPVCAADASACDVCQLDAHHWQVRGPCAACIDAPVCANGLCACFQ